MLKFLKSVSKSLGEIVETIKIVGGYSIITGVFVSLLVHTFTPETLNQMFVEILVLGSSLATLMIILRCLKAIQLKRKWSSKELEQFKCHEIEWLTSCNGGENAFLMGVISLIIALLFTHFNFMISVQIGSWISSIDSTLIVICTLIYTILSISIVGIDISKWIRVETIIQNNRRFEMFCFRNSKEVKEYNE